MADDGDVQDVKPFRFVDDTRLLQTSLTKYFNKPLFSDITVIGPDGRKLLCHQIVLSAGSKRFANMLEQGNLANEELPVWGVDSDALESIIEFFYSGICTLTFPGAVAVMDAANRLDVPSLSAAANTYVRDALSAHTATTVLAHSLQFKLTDLASTCLGLISDKFDDVTGSQDFSMASFDTLQRILGHMQETSSASDESIFRAAWRWIISEPSHPNHMDAVLKIVRVPSSISFAELLQASQQQGTQQGMTATAAAAIAAAAAAAAGSGNQQQSQQQLPSSIKSEPAGAAGAKDAAEQSQSQQRAQSSTGPGNTGAPSPAAAAVAAAAAVPRKETGLRVEVPDVKEGMHGPASSAHNTSQPQGTLSSFDPLHSAQPTPTSKALSGPVDSAMFGSAAAAAAAGGGVDMAAAAAAAAAGMDPHVMATGMDPQFAAMYGSGCAAAGGTRPEGGAAGTAAAAEGAASGAQGSAQPASPSKMAAWGQMGAMQMGGMQMVPGGYMPAHGMHMMGPMGPMMSPHQMMGHQMMGAWSQQQQQQQHQQQQGSGRNHAKGVCQVEGCNADLRGLRDYHLRYKICEYHLKVGSILRDNVPHRFCQQCGRFHPLSDFDGQKRSCRARLLRHNARRRKRGEEEVAATSYGNSSSAMKRGRGSFSQVQADMEDPTAAAAAAAAGGYWPMMGNSMDPYMAMAAMSGYTPDSGYNPAAMMQQYAQYGMMSPTGTMMPNATSDMAAGAAGGGEGEGGASGSAAKRGGGVGGGGSAASEKGKGGSDGDWEEGEEGEDRARDEVAWAAAGLEMLADVAQARSSAAGDRSRAGSDAGTKPAAGGEAQRQQQQQQQQSADDAAAANTASAASAQQPQQEAGSKASQQQEGQQAAAAGESASPPNPCSVVPLQLADSPSPQQARGLFVGRVSPGHDAPPTEPGADDAAAAAGGGSGAATHKRLGGTTAPAGAPVVAAVAADGMHRLAATGGASSSPSNDLGFRADKPAAAGTVQG